MSQGGAIASWHRFRARPRPTARQQSTVLLVCRITCPPEQVGSSVAMQLFRRRRHNCWTSVSLPSSDRAESERPRSLSLWAICSLLIFEMLFSLLISRLSQIRFSCQAHSHPCSDSLSSRKTHFPLSLSF